MLLPKRMFFIQIFIFLVSASGFLFLDVFTIASEAFFVVPVLCLLSSLFVFGFCFVQSFTSQKSYGSIWWIFIYLLLIPSFLSAYAMLYTALGIEASGTPMFPSKQRTFYFSTVTLTTLGYGDFSPATDARLIAASQAFIGFTFVPVILAEIVAYANAKKSNVSDQLVRLEESLVLQNQALHEMAIEHQKAVRTVSQTQEEVVRGNDGNIDHAIADT